MSEINAIKIPRNTCPISTIVFYLSANLGAPTFRHHDAVGNQRWILFDAYRGKEPYYEIVVYKEMLREGEEFDSAHFLLTIS